MVYDSLISDASMPCTLKSLSDFFFLRTQTMSQENLTSINTLFWLHRVIILRPGAVMHPQIGCLGPGTIKALSGDVSRTQLGIKVIKPQGHLVEQTAVELRGLMN